MKAPLILATLGATLAGFGIHALPAHAAVSSANIDGTTATLNLDGADDNVTVSVAGGLLVHGQTTGGLAGASDWDSATPGNQTVPANGTFSVVVNGGDGNDTITVLAKTTEVAGVVLDGEGGDDVLTGADTADLLNGGAGNDRLIGAKGADIMAGDDGNDTLVWNNGDGSDNMDGGNGNDTAEVNGNATLGDTFRIAPDVQAGRIVFERENLVPFTLQTTTEHFQVNGLGGDDSLTSIDGVGARTLLSVDGGAGDDDIKGSDGPDLITGGEGNDILDGGAGDDRIVGDRGSDTMSGDAGDDTLVWNNGDGTDVMDGGDGSDDVEVNGSPTGGDVFNVKPNGARVAFERPNLVPFSLDIGSSETMHANGLGGEDAITVGDVGAFQVTADGGPGDDTLTGGSASETFLGGSGNDTINPGGGLDVVSGDGGDDTVNVRDNTADVARGGDGNDAVVADTPDLDILDGFETVDRTQVDPPAPVDTATRPVKIGGGTVKVSKSARTAAIKVSCPAGSPGNCTGALTLRTAHHVHVAGLSVVLQLGSARFDVSAGASKVVKVKLAKGTERLADRKGHLKALAIASTGSSGSIATTTQGLTLALGTAKKAH
ncbi:MAG TPA: calcium-binding protein [Thermoleophilaceae bacterium]|nr:calcium-binding protein [Thermoleophilaceae bacterium]